MPGAKAHRPQPIKSWTEKSTKAYEKVKENGVVPSPRGLYNKGRTPIPVKSTVGGEWELQTCQEFTEWASNVLKRHKQRPITDLKKGMSDGVTIVNLVEVLFNEKIHGVQTRPIIRAQRVENIHLCLRFLQSRRIDIQGIDSQQIADGNLRVSLLLITRLRKRFDSKFASSGDSHHHNGSIHSSKQNEMQDHLNTNGFHPPIRQGSIRSHVSGVSNHSQELANSYDSTSYSKLRSASFTEKAETILPGGAFGIDETFEESPSKIGEIVSTTELDSRGVLQHKGELYPRQQSQDRHSSIDMEMSRLLLSNQEDGSHSNVNMSANGPPPSSVEERLKSLLEMPNPGGYTDPMDPQDEGEFLELPPPDMINAFSEDGDYFEEEDRLQAMLEDPDNFDDYPKDWDRYVSGYVPSHAAEKKEGPRAQVMLERPQSPRNVAQYQEPFFHGPPREHLGPSPGMQGPPIPGYGNGPSSQPIPRYLDQSGSMAGVVYSEEEPPQQSYSGQETSSQRDVSFNERRLPSYQDHMKKISGSLQRVKSSGSSPHSSGYDSRGHVSPKTLQDRTGQVVGHQVTNGYHPHTFQRQHHMQQYYSSMQGDNEEEYMNITYPQGQHRQYIPHNGQRFDPYVGDQRMSSMETYHFNNTQPVVPSNIYNNSWKGRSLDETSDFTQDYEIYSGTSSRSHTPTLPALSPPETPPGSPPLRKRNRSVSSDMSGINLSFGRSPNSTRKNRDAGRSKRTNEKRQTAASQRRISEPKVAVRKTSGKTKRKVSKSGRHGNKLPESGDTKRSLRALPSLPLHRVQERSEDSDSVDSSRSGHKGDAIPTPHIEEPVRAHQEKELNTVMSPVSTGRDDTTDIATLRQQLMSLENMYQDMLKLVGAQKSRLEGSPRVTAGGIKRSGVSRTSSKLKGNSYRQSAKQREKDVKAINKRFSRVESHVVTLARSVASLSSELRSQTSLVEEIEAIRLELEQLQEITLEKGRSPTPVYRPTVPLATNPHSIKKLTKFFGEEPPLLTLFLTELGYDKYADVFDKAGVGLQELPYLADGHLEKLGIPLGPRTRIIQEAQLMV